MKRAHSGASLQPTLASLWATAGAKVEVEASFACAVCQDLLHEPVTAACGTHQFCMDCLLQWMEAEAKHGREPACPLCKRELQPIEELRVNVGVAAAIEANDGPSYRARVVDLSFLSALKAGRYKSALDLLTPTCKVKQLERYMERAGRTTPLLWSCKAASSEPHSPFSLEVALALVAAGADVSSRDSWGHGPLWHAYRCASTLLSALLDKGAREPAALERIALIYDGSSGGPHLQREAVLVRFLTATDLSSCHKSSKEHALYSCCRIGYDAPAAALINAGVEWRIEGSTLTLLHHAALSGGVATIAALLKTGAAVDALNDVHQTPLHLACLHARKSAALLLIERGATKDLVDSYGKTPSHYIATSATNSIAMAAVVAKLQAA